MKYYVSLLALLCSTSIFFTSCENEDLATPANAEFAEIQNMTHETFVVVEAESNEKVCKAKNPDGPVPTIWEWIDSRCQPTWYDPNCSETLVLAEVDTLTIQYLMPANVEYDFLFVGIGGNPNIHTQGWGGDTGPNGGGCRRVLYNFAQWEIIYGYLYINGELVAMSIYDMVNGNAVGQPDIIYERS